MRKIIVLMCFLLLLVNSSAMPLCQEETDIDNIPCLGLTMIIDCSSNLSVLNLNTSAKTNLTINSIGGSVYNFTFNYSRASYYLTACDNSTATIVVGDFEGDKLWKFALAIGLIGAAFLYGLFGKLIFESDKQVVKMSLYISSILMLLITIQATILISPNQSIMGIMNVSVTLTLAVIIFVFTYLLIYYMVGIFKALRDVKKDKISRI